MAFTTGRFANAKGGDVAVRKLVTPEFNLLACTCGGSCECKCETFSCSCCTCEQTNCCDPYHVVHYKKDYYYPPGLDMVQAMETHGYKGIRKLALFKIFKASAYLVDPKNKMCCG